VGSCAWIAAGYPVLLTAIAVLWKAFHESQKELLREKKWKVRILEEIQELARQRRTQ